MKRFVLALSIFMCGSAVAEYERFFVVVVPSYNNAQWSVQTLESIFAQKYNNYKVIYIDDASTDGNANVVEKYITDHNLWHKCTLIRNATRCRKLKNIYNAIHSCPDHAIIIQPDGDDWLAHDHVFADLNKVYASGDVWLTYGQYRNVPKEEALKWGMKEIGYSAAPKKKVVEQRTFRTTSWVYMQLRTFYAGLFKRIPLKDFITDTVPGYQGQFYPAANDGAMMFPMLEMAHWQFKFLPDIAYIRNLYSPIVGFKVDRSLQKAAGIELRKKPKYPVLAQAPVVDLCAHLEDQEVVVVLYTRGNWQATAYAVQALAHYAKKVGRVCIITPEKTVPVAVRSKLVALYKNISFFTQDRVNASTLGSVFNELLGGYEHCVLATDEQVLSDQVNFAACAKELESTMSYGFYLHNEHVQSLCQHIRDDLFAWKFTRTPTWQGYNNFNYTLYRTSVIKKAVQQSTTQSFAEFYRHWQDGAVSKDATGLLYAASKVRAF